MKSMLIACGAVAALACPPASAQNAPATCYVELGKLMADPPNGVGDLGAAIRQLDAALRPQVEEVKLLKAELERLQQRQREVIANPDAEGADLVDLQDRTLALATELEAKQNQLKLDYEAQRAVLLGPVQARVSERAQAFASQRGCGQMKMARSSELAGLQATSARNVTVDFISWYSAH